MRGQSQLACPAVLQPLRLQVGLWMVPALCPLQLCVRMAQGLPGQGWKLRPLSQPAGILQSLRDGQRQLALALFGLQVALPLAFHARPLPLQIALQASRIHVHLQLALRHQTCPTHIERMQLQAFVAPLPLAADMSSYASALLTFQVRQKANDMVGGFETGLASPYGVGDGAVHIRAADLVELELALPAL